MTQRSNPSDSAANGSATKRSPRRMLTRVLPGGVMVAAALTVPEFSVGAGDIGRGAAPLDPPEPAAKPDHALAKRVAASTAPTHAKLSGVRYAPIIDLGTDTSRVAGRAAGEVQAKPARASLGAKAKLSEAAPMRDKVDQAFADLAAVPAAPAALTAPAGTAPAIAPVAAPEAALAVAAVPAAPGLTGAPAAVPSAAVPAELAAAPEMPVPPAAVADDTAAFASLLPEEQTALRAPAGTGTPLAAPVSAPARVSASVASAPAPAAAPAALAARPAVAASPAGRGAMEQITPARIAAAKTAPAATSAAPTAPARSASQPITAPAPKAVAAPAAPATPGTRAPIAAPAAAKPIAAPAAAAAAAAAVPKQPPALSAPASAGAQRIADLDFRSRLITRVDGRAKGQVDFQQTPAGLKVRLGSVAEVLADRIAPADLARIRSSSAGNSWLSLAELQAQGIPISYDPVYDEFNIGQQDTRPKAGRKVHMDQISTPERSAGAAAMDQIPRRR